MAKNKLVLTIYKRFLSRYGPQGWWPVFDENTGKIEYHKNNYEIPTNEQQQFEIGVGAILTQNAAWKNVEKSLYELKNQNVLIKNGIEKINNEKLAGLIKSSVYHNQKTKKLKLFVEMLKKKEKITRGGLLETWGIGPETADSILLYAYKMPVFVVDAYTKRIFLRIGLVCFSTFEK